MDLSDIGKNSTRYILIYSLENINPKGNILRCSRREIRNGNLIFSFRDHLILIDEKGIWGYKEKMYFIREIGNPSTNNILNMGDFCLIFCCNGEIYKLEKDYSISLLGKIHKGKYALSFIGNIVFLDNWIILIL